jgi:superfamily I DNA/RNA helicase
VLGTAGSGKTTLAILRAAYLADPETDHHGKTLLVTFNRALVTYLRHLQDRALKDVVVENYHTFARGYLNARGKMPNNGICSDSTQRESLIRSAVREIADLYDDHPLFDRPIEIFSEEIRWMAQHGVTTLEDYETIERIGRSSARFDRRVRQLVFEIREAYRATRGAAGKIYDWDDLATAVRREFSCDTSARRYRHVVIDEGQDFSPEMLRSLAAAIHPDGSITFFGDVAQQIYGHRMSWRSAGLKISKTWEFKENYRNSKSIARLALAVSKMPYFKDVPDMVEPVAPSAEGPPPTLVECSSRQIENDLVVNQATEFAKTLSVAILFRNRHDERLIKPRLPRGAIRLHRDMTTWQAGPGIRYGTYHSSKGLEFDAVILPFFSRDRLPDPDEIAAFGDEEARSRDGRLLYVAVTRAKTYLVLTCTGQPTTLLPRNPALYNLVKR